MIASVGIYSSYATVTYDTDAQAFFTAAGITDSGQKTAVNTLVLAAKANGWWTKCATIYPFVGGDATKHSYNLKNTAQYQISFTGSWVHSSTGALADGSTTFADTGLVPLSVLGQFSTHLSSYTRNNTDVGDDLGSIGSGFFFMANRATGSGLYLTNDANFAVIPSVASSVGYFVGTRTANNSAAFYRNGSSLATETGTETGALSNASIYIGAINNGGPSDQTTREYAFVTIGDGLSGTDVSNMYTDIQAFQTSLSRQV